MKPAPTEMATDCEETRAGALFSERILKYRNDDSMAMDIVDVRQARAFQAVCLEHVARYPHSSRADVT
jgi:hypothetical protein